MQMQLLPAIGLLALLGPACRPAANLDAVRADILGLHRASIEAHLAKDAVTLVEPIPDDYIFVAPGDVDTLRIEDHSE